jgi:hypothetical protein
MARRNRYLDWLLTKKRAYCAALLDANGKPTRNGEVILSDLARFCSAHRPCVRLDKTGAVDPIASALVAGRNEVWLRLMEQLHLDEKYLTNLREALPEEQ